MNKSKASDVLFDQIKYLSHRQRVRSVRPDRYIGNIQRVSQEYEELCSQRLSFIQQVNQRKKQEVNSKNRQLLKKLLQVQRRDHETPEHEVGHYNSYFSSRLDRKRIRDDNSSLLGRLIETRAAVPSKVQLKRSYRKLQKVIRLQERHKKEQRLKEHCHQVAKRKIT